MFNNYAIVQGVDHIVPVDMYLPGCPPRPEMLIDAILKLHEKIMHEPLGDRRRKQLEARVERDGPPVVAPGAMPSCYRFDKASAARVGEGGRARAARSSCGSRTGWTSGADLPEERSDAR